MEDSSHELFATGQVTRREVVMMPKHESGQKNSMGWSRSGQWEADRREVVIASVIQMHAAVVVHGGGASGGRALSRPSGV
ncbi:hypothetical protein [Streptomyces sp. NPDC021562]|uniref:hypothetical protein n=1 Tax=Streptomyces sp. NPDC021562 TaxID=3155121 RepID=UPI0033E0C338